MKEIEKSCKNAIAKRVHTSRTILLLPSLDFQLKVQVDVGFRDVQTKGVLVLQGQ